MASLSTRIKSAWNIFLDREEDLTYDFKAPGNTTYYHPDRPRLSRGNDRTIVTAIYNRIAVDVAAVDMYHVRVDENKQFQEEIKSGLDYCLTTEANIDQTGRHFIQDIVLTLMDEGVAAVVPVDTTTDPEDNGAYDIQTMRVGRIKEWKPYHVKVELYNDRKGEKEEILLHKSTVAIIENPFYAVINDKSSTMQRLIRKLNLLDVIDEQTSAGKLDLIIQLPYVIKSQARREQAEARRKDIENQLAGSKYGIAYTDGTEHITQLNRPVENNLMSQIEYLTSMLYSQLGITQSIMDGTADEQTMLNYYNRTIEPFLSAIADEFKRKFLTKTARTQNQSVEFYRDPFKLVPVNNIADIADKFTRNEITSSNEMRAAIGMRPSKDPAADELRNKNISQPADEAKTKETPSVGEGKELDVKQLVERYLKSNKEEIQNG